MSQINEEVNPLTALHATCEAAQKTYNETVETAKQVRDEAIKASQEQYAQSLKAHNAAVEAASRK